jgi:hypothetical protein
MNDKAVITYCSDTSRADVNLRINAKIRLLNTAKTTIKINPYRIEVPKLFDSILTLPLQLPSGWHKYSLHSVLPNPRYKFLS